MKTLVNHIIVLLILSLLISSVVYGQIEKSPTRSSYKISDKSKTAYTSSLVQQDIENHRNSRLSDKFKYPNNNIQKLDDIDTLNYPLVGTYSIYSADAGGYVTGNNFFNDQAKANKFVIPQACQLTGILFDFYLATGGPTDIEIVVWDNSGPVNAPGEIIASKSIPISSIQNDISNNQLTFVEFDEPLTITTTFYAGMILPTFAGDTLVVWSNSDGDIIPGIAWEQWEDNSWVPMFSSETWGKNLAMAIFPIVDYDGLPLMADFMGSATNVQPGGSVTFTDLSTGNPTSRLWTFEGGDPATSIDASVVVTYESIGSYDVTLKVEKDTIEDTKMVADYITVAEPTIEIDTLNYPLPGEYAIYITEGDAYVTGNNEYGDLAKANYYSINENTFITGVLFEFAIGTGGGSSIEFAIWDNNGLDNSPGSKIAFKSKPLNDILDDIESEAFTYVEFDPPVLVNEPFYAGFMLPTASNDTLVVWSNLDGDSPPNIAWDLWNTEEWYSISSTYSLEIAMAIYPIVQKIMDVDENVGSNGIVVFPNPSNGKFTIVPGVYNTPSMQLEVFNTSGDLIKSQVLDKGDGPFSLDITDFSDGMYMVRLFDGQQSYTQKVLKQ